jgi:hypothetical protein
MPLLTFSSFHFVSFYLYVNFALVTVTILNTLFSNHTLHATKFYIDIVYLALLQFLHLQLVDG